MQRYLDPQLSLDVVLDGVEHLMVGKGVALARHLDMRACELTARAVIVHHKVMRAQDPGIRHDLGVNAFNKPLVWSLAQKRTRRVAHQIDATGTHKKAHAQACPAIKVDTRGTGDERSRQDRTRGDHVISGVDGSSEKRPRIDAIPQAPIE